MRDIPIQKLETRDEAAASRIENVREIKTFTRNIIMDVVRKYSITIIIAIVGPIGGYIVGVGKFDFRVSGLEGTVAAQGVKIDTQDLEIKSLQTTLDANTKAISVFGARQDLMIEFFGIPVPADK